MLLAALTAAPAEVYAQNEPVILEAESGARSAADYTLGSADGVQFISINSTVGGQNPTVASRVVTFSVTFPAAATYELYARVRVGPNTFNDDSFYYANGFGVKAVSADNSADGNWILANNLANPVGYTTPTDKVVGGLFPNDGDGNAWGDPKLGFAPALAKENFKLVDPGRFQNLTQDFSAQIAAFKKDNVEIVTGVVIPPDMKTFATQAKQQGLKPKVITVGKALLFPAAIEALGDLGDGMSTEVWWTPTCPFKSSLTGQSAAQLADAYTAATKKQWTQPIGFVHALFEVSIDSLKRAKNVGDKAAIRDALASTDLATIVGPIAWGKGPVKNVTRTPLVGGQWVRGKKYKYELIVVDNRTAPAIPTGGKLKLLNW